MVIKIAPVGRFKSRYTLTAPKTAEAMIKKEAEIKK